MKPERWSLLLACSVLFGALGAGAQTLTCTFQFTGSGTLGTSVFTNAAITITTVGDTQNRQLRGGGSAYMSNTSATVSIGGMGTFQIKTPPPLAVVITPPNAAPGATVLEQFTLGSFGVGGAILYLDQQTNSPWDMLSSFGPITTDGVVQEWNTYHVTTNAGVINVYDSYVPSVKFQGILTGGTPSPVLSRSGVLSHIAAGGGWTTVRRQLLFPVNDNYFSLSTTITPEAAQRAAAGGGR